MATKSKVSSYLELTPEELAEIDKESKNTLKSCYMIDFTQKKLNKNYGFGKINAFVDGNKLNPKLESSRKEPNSQYIKKIKHYYHNLKLESLFTNMIIVV